MKRFLIPVVVILAMTFSTSTFAQKNPMVGGAAMYSSKDIVDNAVNSKDHTTTDRNKSQYLVTESYQ